MEIFLLKKRHPSEIKHSMHTTPKTDMRVSVDGSGGVKTEPTFGDARAADGTKTDVTTKIAREACVETETALGTGVAVCGKRPASSMEPGQPDGTSERQKKRMIPVAMQSQMFSVAGRRDMSPTILRWYKLWGAVLMDMKQGNVSFIRMVVKKDNVDALAALVGAGLDVNYVMKESKTTLITLAAFSNAHECLDFLKENGASVNVDLGYGVTLAHEAVRGHALKSLQTIAGWNPELLLARDDFDCSPFDYLSGKQSGRHVLTCDKDFCADAMACALFLAQHIDEAHAATALKPFSRLHRNSLLLGEIQEFETTYCTKIPFFHSLTATVRNEAYYLSFFLLDLRSLPVEDLQSAFQQALEQRTPANVVQKIEDKFYK